MTELIIVACGLGIGLAMDAFSVSLANGLNEPKMKKARMLLIAGTFAFFQALMPMIGWVCVNTILSLFEAFKRFIPWIALLLLAYIGGSMIVSGVRKKAEEDEVKKLGIITLLLQGIATSIDALSVGFDICRYNVGEALLSALIIAVETLVICLAGLIIGKKFGTRLANLASILGGIVLVVIGIWIFISNIIANGGI